MGLSGVSVTVVVRTESPGSGEGGVTSEQGRWVRVGTLDGEDEIRQRGVGVGFWDVLGETSPFLFGSGLLRVYKV